MPFNQTEITQLGLYGLNAYMRNKPIDQIGTDRPLLKLLMGMKRPFGGGNQYIVEQIRTKYDSNFQWYHGSRQVNHNKKKTLQQSNFGWGSVFDGFTLNEDEFVNNGIIVNDQVKGQATKNEKVQLTQLFNENMESLRLGFEEKFDYEMHLDGTQNADAVPGLDHLVSLDGLGTVGGINASLATNVYWRNNAVTSGVISTNLIETMEKQWRACTRFGGGRPDAILVGQEYLDMFRVAAKGDISAYTVLKTDSGTRSLDPSVSGLHFKGVELVWDPVFADLDDNLSPATPWEKRCYMLNTKHLKYRPVRGHDMVTRNPPREHDRFQYYWGLTNKFAMTTNKRNAQSVIAID